MNSVMKIPRTIVTRYVGSGWILGSQPLDQGSQTRSGSAVFCGIKDRAELSLWDQGRNFVTSLETRIRNLGREMESATKEHTSLRPCPRPMIQKACKNV